MGFSGLVCLTAVELRGSRGVFLLVLALLLNIVIVNYF